MTIGIVIRPDKTIEEREFNSLRDRQKVVEGYIEAIYLSDGSTMWINEEGRYQFGATEFNSIATDVCGLGGRADILLQGILGPVIVEGPVDADGDGTNITDTARRWIQRVSREA